ncbi:hypothetical protein HOD08_02815 [bacterium]|nr:hypothetical protein [bacterium]
MSRKIFVMIAIVGLASTCTAERGGAPPRDTLAELFTQIWPFGKIKTTDSLVRHTLAMNQSMLDKTTYDDMRNAKILSGIPRWTILLGLPAIAFLAATAKDKFVPQKNNAMLCATATLAGLLAGIYIDKRVNYRVKDEDITIDPTNTFAHQRILPLGSIEKKTSWAALVLASYCYNELCEQNSTNKPSTAWVQIKNSWLERQKNQPQQPANTVSFKVEDENKEQEKEADAPTSYKWNGNNFLASFLTGHIAKAISIFETWNRNGTTTLHENDAKIIAGVALGLLDFAHDTKLIDEKHPPVTNFSQIAGLIAISHSIISFLGDGAFELAYNALEKASGKYKSAAQYLRLEPPTVSSENRRIYNCFYVPIKTTLADSSTVVVDRDQAEPGPTDN